MKKITVLIGALFLMLALSACGAKTNSNTGAESSPSGSIPPGNSQQLTITASNWKFDQAEYRVKKGQPVTLTLKNAEGVHGIEVQKLGIKLDHKAQTKTFTPDAAGKYTIVCTIPCGTDHMKMRAVLVVEE
ncbi:MAG: subunit of cytochrome oxidase [Paenibacillaceae bacterium]|jgi:cytochrome c oxidase subunit 2|nr:subunit of cytochrome oxidase [Paenibacillaceae bacterium]